MDVDKAVHMCESFLTILLSLVGFHKLSGRDSLRTCVNLEKEIIVILATKDCGHAEILRNVPGGRVLNIIFSLNSDFYLIFMGNFM